MAAERRLAAPNLADKNNKSLAFGYAVLEALERLLVGGAQLQIFGIGSYVERQLLKSVIIRIHSMSNFGRNRWKFKLIGQLLFATERAFLSCQVNQVSASPSS
jgi:hypothetical protein